MRVIGDLLLEHAYLLDVTRVFVPGAIDGETLVGRQYNKDTGEDMGYRGLSIARAIEDKTMLFPDCMNKDYRIPKNSALDAVMRTVKVPKR